MVEAGDMKRTVDPVQSLPLSMVQRRQGGDVLMLDHFSRGALWVAPARFTFENPVKFLPHRMMAEVAGAEGLSYAVERDPLLLVQPLQRGEVLRFDVAAGHQVAALVIERRASSASEHVTVQCISRLTAAAHEEC